MPLGTGKIGKNTVEVLRDSSCYDVNDKWELVKKDDFTGSMGYVRVIQGCQCCGPNYFPHVVHGPQKMLPQATSGPRTSVWTSLGYVMAIE